MRRKIPSTGSLLAFEAAARHGSFSRAAEELHLTEGAVSRQISRLESFLGLQLFVRVKNRVVLTENAHTYWGQITTDLMRIENETLSLIGRPETAVLELAVIPTFTNHWLIPRLPDFLHIHPGITINMTERPEPFVFADSVFDAAVHYDHPAWTGMMKNTLFVEDLVAVCAPKLLPSRRTPTLADLASLPLLHKRGRSEEWRKWWDELGYEDINPMAGPQYDLFSMVIEAARAGLGIALVPRLYVQKELVNGTFVIPHCGSHSGDKRYCIVYPQAKAEQWPLTEFIGWVASQADQYCVERRVATGGSDEAFRKPPASRRIAVKRR